MTRQSDIPSLTTSLENGQADTLKQAFQGLGLDQRINLLDLVEAQNKQDRQAGKTKTELSVWHNIPSTKDLLSDDKDDSLLDEVPDNHVNLGLTRNPHKGMLGGLFSSKVLYSEMFYPLNNRLSGDGSGLQTKDDSSVNIPQLTIQLEGGNGSALKQVFAGVGLDERIQILDDVIAQNGKDIKANSSTARLRASHSISELQLDTYDPHIDLALSRSTQKGLAGAFKGDILYSEEYYPRSNRDTVQAKDVS